jgi:peptidoglycan hydrolase-like protein with peptidoglycan-binding domain
MKAFLRLRPPCGTSIWCRAVATSFTCALIVGACGSEKDSSSSNPSASSSEAPLPTVGAPPTVSTTGAASDTGVPTLCEALEKDPALTSRLRWPALKSGDNSDRVLVLQYLLVDARLNVEPDGRFGPGTESVLKNFQETRNAPQTGETSAANWLALLSDCNVASSTSKVKAFQVALRIPGYQQKISGVLDASTKANLARSRADSGASATGDVGAGDWLTLVGVGD